MARPSEITLGCSQRRAGRRDGRAGDQHAATIMAMTSPDEPLNRRPVARLSRM